MKWFENWRAKARSRPQRIAFPEATEARVLAAARQLRDDDLARPVLVGDADEIAAAARAAGIGLDGLERLAPGDAERDDAFVAAYCEGRPRTSPKVARRLLGRPTFYAGMALKAGLVDAMVAGAAQPTARVIEAGLMSVGLAPGIDTPSSFFIMLPISRWPRRTARRHCSARRRGSRCCRSRPAAARSTPAWTR